MTDPGAMIFFPRSFTHVELSARPDLISQLVPEFAEVELRSRGIDVDHFVATPLRDLRISVD